MDGSTGRNASVTPAKPYQCNSCERSFQRPQDIARHRCVTTCPNVDDRSSSIGHVFSLLFITERHHPFGWLSFKVKVKVCVCVCVCVCV